MSGTTYYTIEEHLLSMYEQTGRKWGLWPKPHGVRKLEEAGPGDLNGVGRD